MKYLKKITNYFYNIFFRIDQKMLFIWVEPYRYPASPSNKIIINNLFYLFINLRLIETIKKLIFLIYFNIINILSIFFIPLNLIFKKIKYKFVQINFTQIGILNEHLCFMVKKNKIDGFNSIILIPKSSKFGFLKDIFSNLKIIDNEVLNIILSPLKHFSFSSCKTNSLDHFLDESFSLTLSSPHSKIYKKFNKEFKNTEIFNLKIDYIEKEKKKFFEENSELDLNNLLIFHHREKYYLNRSDLRGSDIETYVDGLNFLINKGYSLIRLVDKYSKKNIIQDKNYKEYSIDNLSNQKSQYFLINNCRGFIGNGSGPISIATLFDKPILETNIWGQRVHAFNNKGSFILKKVCKDGKVISYKEAINLNYYKGIHLSHRKMLELGLNLQDNSSEEILESFKHFDNLINIEQFIPSIEQNNFKKFLPDYMEMKNTDSNIDPYFINTNKDLFKNLIF